MITLYHLPLDITEQSQGLWSPYKGTKSLECSAFLGAGNLSPRNFCEISKKFQRANNYTPFYCF